MLFRKKIPLLIVCILFSILHFVSAQSSGQITFQATTSLGQVKLWRVQAAANSPLTDISSQLDGIATHPGGHKGPIIVSPDGAWYVFLSERFDVNSQGWHGLTLARADLKSAETVKVNGETIHGDAGVAAAGGNSIVYVDGGGPHSRDLFIVKRSGPGWTSPVCLTTSSTSAFNYMPVLSKDSSRVLFDAGETSFPSTRICEVRLDGTGFRVVTTKDNGPAGLSASSAVHSPSYAPDGSIVFEAEWGGGERLWRIPKDGGTPVAVNNTYSNDNSPSVLPDGRIASLWLGSATGMGLHEIKVMDAEGQNAFMLTSSSSPFVEVDDIGIGSGPSNPLTSIPEGKILPQIFQLEQNYPNPFNPSTTIGFTLRESGPTTLKVYDMLGREVASLVNEHLEAGVYHQKMFDASRFASGIYYARLQNGKSVQLKKMVLVK
jgi:hypothetical protein